MNFPTIWPQFFTATILNWKPLLEKDEYKQIITDFLRFLVADKRIELNAFAVMSNHVHLIWQPLQKYSLSQIQFSFMTKTATEIKKKLSVENPSVLEEFKVNKYDRTYQMWMREPLSIELFTEKTFLQKLEYIHNNPVIAGLVTYPEQYNYSSARYYFDGVDEFKMITHYSGN